MKSHVTYCHRSLTREFSERADKSSFYRSLSVADSKQPSFVIMLDAHLVFLLYDLYNMIQIFNTLNQKQIEGRTEHFDCLLFFHTFNIMWRKATNHQKPFVRRTIGIFFLRASRSPSRDPLNKNLALRASTRKINRLFCRLSYPSYKIFGISKRSLIFHVL